MKNTTRSVCRWFFLLLLQAGLWVCADAQPIPTSGPPVAPGDPLTPYYLSFPVAGKSYASVSIVGGQVYKTAKAYRFLFEKDRTAVFTAKASGRFDGEDFAATYKAPVIELPPEKANHAPVTWDREILRQYPVGTDLVTIDINAIKNAAKGDVQGTVESALKTAEQFDVIGASAKFIGIVNGVTKLVDFFDKAKLIETLGGASFGLNKVGSAKAAGYYTIFFSPDKNEFAAYVNPAKRLSWNAATQQLYYGDELVANTSYLVIKITYTSRIAGKGTEAVELFGQQERTHPWARKYRDLRQQIIDTPPTGTPAEIKKAIRTKLEVPHTLLYADRLVSSNEQEVIHADYLDALLTELAGDQKQLVVASEPVRAAVQEIRNEAVEEAKIKSPELSTHLEANRAVVFNGDTAEKIKKRAGVTWEELQQANPGIDLSNLKVGTKIKLPPKQ
ncbi:MAG: LysM peptidoglycan-binding domain-containing protein [Verrucomicrobia bacterium]|nr:LysM peptidoglycan-binding domain-containing protein [Verrucomicrobiota bacterium]